MSRRIAEDFDVLNSFIKNYHFSEFATKQSELCKSMHKKLYGFLIFAAEFKKQKVRENSDIFFEDICSDLMLSFFCALQGMFKPAKLQLRCSIESFLKALIMKANPKIVEEKSVYVIFDIAKEDPHFCTTLGDQAQQNVHSIYVDLCHTVHGDVGMISPLSALALLPQCDESRLNEYAKKYVDCIENYLLILYLNYPSVIDRMHPDNKKDIMDCMSKRTKAAVIKELYG